MQVRVVSNFKATNQRQQASFTAGYFYDGLDPKLNAKEVDDFVNSLRRAKRRRIEQEAKKAQRPQRPQETKKTPEIQRSQEARNSILIVNRLGKRWEVSEAEKIKAEATDNDIRKAIRKLFQTLFKVPGAGNEYDAQVLSQMKNILLLGARK